MAFSEYYSLLNLKVLILISKNLILFQLKVSLGRSSTTSTVATKRTMTTTDGDSLKSIKIRENGADEEIEHEVVLRMDPEGFDFETRPKSTEASLV